MRLMLTLAALQVIGIFGCDSTLGATLMACTQACHATPRQANVQAHGLGSSTLPH